jgi:hypothetical protein
MAARNRKCRIFGVEIWKRVFILTSKWNSIKMLTCSPGILQSWLLAACSSRHTKVTWSSMLTVANSCDKAQMSCLSLTLELFLDKITTVCFQSPVYLSAPVCFLSSSTSFNIHFGTSWSCDSWINNSFYWLYLILEENFTVPSSKNCSWPAQCG